MLHLHYIVSKNQAMSAELHLKEAQGPVKSRERYGLRVTGCEGAGFGFGARGAG